MAEIEISESHVDVDKVLDIKPNSEINMNDCDYYWKEVFAKEIMQEEVQIVEKTRSNSESAMESVKDFWDDIFSETMENEEEIVDEGLSHAEKDLIKQETGWSDEIVDAIRNMDEYKVYKAAGLVEGEVDGKKCLMKADIDWEQKDQFGSTNRERVAEGHAPLDKTEKPIQ